MSTNNHNFLIHNLSKMISIPSINPFGAFDLTKPAEADMAHFFQKCLSDFGLETFDHEISHGRKNVWGIVRGYSSGPTILLAGHLDTVGVDGYKDPFIPRLEGDRIYGRGACDMKGGLATSIVAAEAFIAIYPNFNGSIEILAFL